MKEKTALDFFVVIPPFSCRVVVVWDSVEDSGITSSQPSTWRMQAVTSIPLTSFEYEKNSIHSKCFQTK